MIGSQIIGYTEVLALEGVSVLRGGQFLLTDIDWHVQQHERWVLLGSNGSGKTTMMQVASTYLGPTSGTVRLLGETYGKVDARKLRERVGYVGSGISEIALLSVDEFAPDRCHQDRANSTNHRDAPRSSPDLDPGNPYRLPADSRRIHPRSVLPSGRSIAVQESSLLRPPAFA